jgi:flagellum-specific peptidoglycan hydrolase FlgJ
MMAQAILESGNGTSRLAREGNNHFGIKCHSSWRGESMLANDDRPNECFRVYATALDSFYDRNKFLKENPRYEKAGVFDAPSPLDQIIALKKAGYATAPNYVEVIVQIMDAHNLYQLDVQKENVPLTKQIEASLAVSSKPMVFVKSLILVLIIILIYKLWRAI